MVGGAGLLVAHPAFQQVGRPIRKSWHILCIPQLVFMCRQSPLGLADQVKSHNQECVSVSVN